MLRSQLEKCYIIKEILLIFLRWPTLTSAGCRSLYFLRASFNWLNQAQRGSPSLGSSIDSRLKHLLYCSFFVHTYDMPEPAHTLYSYAPDYVNGVVENIQFVVHSNKKVVPGMIRSKDLA